MEIHQPVYFLSRQGKTSGPFSMNEIIRIFRRKDHDGYTGDSLYRRKWSKTWRPLRTFGHFELYDLDERIAQYKKYTGIRYLKWLSARLPSECTICKDLHGKIYNIDEPPKIPPPGCQCELWCLCMLVASDGT